ncbi:MAG TPA: type 1 glutamine amidotransferase domain-containing protein [Chryseosolibacter sp.]
MPKLNDLTIAILTEEGFEQVELTSPREALEKAGVTVHIISPKKDEVKAWNETEWGIRVRVDKQLSEANPEEYDGLMLPGGVLNPDKLRINKEAVEFVRHFLEAGKPIAAICHGPQTMIETGLLEGRRMTSYPAIKTDLINAGVEWVDEEVVTDHGLVTSRSPKDLTAFNKKMLEEFAEGIHQVAH